MIARQSYEPLAGRERDINVYPSSPGQTGGAAVMNGRRFSIEPISCAFPHLLGVHSSLQLIRLLLSEPTLARSHPFFPLLGLQEVREGLLSMAVKILC